MPKRRSSRKALGSRKTRSPGKATRKPKTSRVERTRAGNRWTEAQFWGFVRSNLRLMARKWPPIRDAKKAARRPYRGPNPRQKWETQCCHCQQWFMDKQTQVDHIEAAGACRSFEQAAEFMRRLLVELPVLRVLCHKCHQERHANEE